MRILEPLRIDGSYGEGGGQIVRTALALSAITKRPLELVNIRKGRSRPGLGNQHLACVKALARITKANVQGAQLGSTELFFAPSDIQAGEWVCDVAQERGSAGSVTLLLQALLPVLCVARAPSHLTLRGGTHVPWSPPVQYVQWVLFPLLRRLGLDVSLDLMHAGWYPAGGGEVSVHITPAAHLKPAQWLTRGALKRISGASLVSNVPYAIAERQAQAVGEWLRRQHLDVTMACEAMPSAGQGTCVVLVAECESLVAGFSVLGERGTRAEHVGHEAAHALASFLQQEAALERHVADQLVVFLALAQGRSEFSVSAISRHLLTNLWVIQQCLPVRVSCDGAEGQPGHVVIEPA